mmetsp:Transcript_14219/g.17035  ORF Transcript_14219/g.17035 Transcript_14219/m.17035 type:complete len:108 (-) Transcript_14219:99-422(-)
MGDAVEGSELTAEELRELQMRSRIEEKLVQEGEKEKILDLLRKRLIESGWRDQLKKHCSEIIRNKGQDKITIDDLAKEIMPMGKAKIPQKVKEEMLERLQKFLANSS